MGLPGSGKSTYASDYLKDHIENTVWCSSDNIRKVLYGDEAIQGNPQTVFRHLHNKVAEYLNRGYNVVYDATNVTRKCRKGIISLAKSLNAHIHGTVVWASYKECIARDKARDRQVGVNVINKFIKNWQSPYYDEGFDSLEIVYNTEIDPIKYTHQLEDNMKIPHDNPHHSLGIWEHCQEAGRLMEQEPQANNRLKYIMKFHDCGKPFTKFFKESDPTHAHYYNHNNVGGYLMYGSWAGLEDEYSNNILLTSWAICNHMEPFFNSKYYNNLPTDLKDMLDLIHKCDVNAH